MSKKKKTIEELLEEALIPEEEQPYEVPENWVWTRLGVIGNYYNGRAFKPTEWSDKGRPIIRIQDLTGTNKGEPNYFQGDVEKRHEITKGDLLISWSATLGAFIWDGPDAVLNQHIFKVESHIDKMYHFYAVKNLINILYAKTQGTGMVHVTKKAFDSTPIPLPPLNEQKRIAEKVERLLRKIDEAKQLIEEAKETFELRRAAILDKAFRGEFTRKWREENKNIPSALEQIQELHIRRLNDYKLNKTSKSKKPEYLNYDLHIVVEQNPNLPNGWIVVPVGFLCDCIVPGRDKPKSFTGDIPWVTIPDIVADEIADNQSGLYLSQQEINEVNAKVIPKNSVIMSCVGRFGISAVVKNPIVINQQLHAFLPSDLVLPKYLMYHIKILKTYMENIATSTTIAYLNKKNANSLPINLPTIEEQEVIVDIIERLFCKLDAEEALLSDMNRHLDNLKQSILSKAFRGELGTNDPSEENSIELLKEVLHEQVK
jgi:type I restriction enzyme, S subunit